MIVDYKHYMHQSLTVGQRIDIEGTDWYCFIPCVLVGVILDTNTPVIECKDGVMLVQDDQLRLKSECASLPKPEHTSIENTILTKYKKIRVKQLVGKEIIVGHKHDDSLIIITADNSYVKLSVQFDYEDSYLATDDLILRDLLVVGLIAVDVWGAHKKEVEETREENSKRDAEQKLLTAVHQLGMGHAKKLMGLT